MNSAGAIKGGNFSDQPNEDFIDRFTLKFYFGVRFSRLFRPMLKVSKDIVFMMVGGPVSAAFENFLKALAGQVLIDVVNLNWVRPDQTEIEQLHSLLERRAEDERQTVDTACEERGQNEAIRRLGRSNDVAELVCFLCRNKVRYINGTEIAIDGGALKGYINGILFKR